MVVAYRLLLHAFSSNISQFILFETTLSSYVSFSWQSGFFRDAFKEISKLAYVEFMQVSRRLVFSRKRPKLALLIVKLYIVVIKREYRPATKWLQPNLQRHHHTGKTVVIYLAEVKYFGPKGKPQYFNKKFGRKCCSKHIF